MGLVFGFAVVQSPRVIPSPNHFTPCATRLFSDTKDDNFSFENLGDETGDGSSPSPSSTQRLGIDFGKELVPDNDIQTLKEALKKMINEKVANGLDELNKLHDKWERDLELQLEPLEQAMMLNGMRESKKFNKKVDMLIGKFMNETYTSRERTHLMALEDERRIKKEEMEKKQRQKKKDEFQTWKKTNDPWDAWEEEW
jgi:hypothetical protein